jgi:hypothetical protein
MRCRVLLTGLSSCSATCASKHRWGAIRLHVTLRGSVVCIVNRWVLMLADNSLLALCIMIPLACTVVAVPGFLRAPSVPVLLDQVLSRMLLI